MLWRENFSTSLFSVRSRERALVALIGPLMLYNSLSLGGFAFVWSSGGEKKKSQQHNSIPLLSSPHAIFMLLTQKAFSTHTQNGSEGIVCLWFSFERVWSYFFYWGKEHETTQKTLFATLNSRVSLRRRRGRQTRTFYVWERDLFGFCDKPPVLSCNIRFRDLAQHLAFHNILASKSMVIRYDPQELFFFLKFYGKKFIIFWLLQERFLRTGTVTRRIYF